MYPGKFRGRVGGGGNKDQQSVHPVHLTLQASATPVVERNIRQATPDRLTRDQAATFRPSDLPIVQGPRRSSAHSDGSSSHSYSSGPLKTIGFGPPALVHTMSETRLFGSKRNVVSPSKVYASEFAQLSVGDQYRRHVSNSESETPQLLFQETSPRNFARGQNQQQKSTPCLPGDRVIFAESPSAPGIPIIYRTMEERSANPDRLNLDRRHLSVCPILEGEEHLRLLNFQHNMISHIQHLSNLRRLIFLDLYDNQIEDMNGLSALKSLRVLMLGKNRIQQITGLETLLKLDVLDLHGNQISIIENLNHLSELRVLNLAGNQIEHVNSLAGMGTLAELNLRRNNIKSVAEIDFLSSLQRLFLSFNAIRRWTDIGCLSDASTLCEISLDGNPISTEACYKQIVIKSMPQLRQLDMKRITEDERRVAAVMLRKEEERKREVHKQVSHFFMSTMSEQTSMRLFSILQRFQEIISDDDNAIAMEKKRLAINNAARLWKSEYGEPHTTQLWKSLSMTTNPKWELGSNNHPSDQWEEYTNEQRDFYTDALSDAISPATSRSGVEGACSVKELGSRRSFVDKTSNNGKSISMTSLEISDTYLAEIDGENLQLFGQGALDSLDKNWGNQASSSVTTVVAQFINFDDFSQYLGKIRARFPNAMNFVLKEMNLHSLQQINALSQLKRLHFLTIECGPGNPVTQFSLWKHYALFRLSHLSLNKLNEDEVTVSEVESAKKVFNSLSLVTTSQLSQFRLVALLGDTRQKVVFNKEPKKEKQPEDTDAVEAVEKAGLKHISTKALLKKIDETERRGRIAKHLVEKMSKEASAIAKKQMLLSEIWPMLFVDMIKDTVIDMWDINSYHRIQRTKFEET